MKLGSVLTFFVEKVHDGAVVSIGEDEFTVYICFDDDPDHAVYPATARNIRSASSAALGWFDFFDDFDG